MVLLIACRTQNECVEQTLNLDVLNAQVNKPIHYISVGLTQTHKLVLELFCDWTVPKTTLKVKKKTIFFIYFEIRVLEL